MRVRSSSLLASTTSARGRPWTLTAILAAALVLRVALVVLLRHHLSHDARIFISWAHLLMQYGPHGLYAHVDAIDGYPVNYPPGYSVILGAVTLVYRALVAAPRENDVLLGMLLKAPAIAADLGLCILAYGIVGRWFGVRAALWAAAIAALSPATWPISAVWGQVDSLCAMFMVLALACSLGRRYTLAWIVLSCAVLVKPLPVVVAPLILAAQLRDERRWWMLTLGPAAGLGLAYGVSLPFAPSASPFAVARWLGECYSAGQSLSTQTSVNAYNLWTVLGPPVSDSLHALGVPLHVWGWTAFGLLGVAVVAQYVLLGRVERDRAAWERLTTRAWFIVLTAMFCSLTRMHERYILFALALVPLVWFCGKIERRAALTLLAAFVVCVVLVLGFYEHHVFAELPAATRLLSAVNLIALATLLWAFFRPHPQGE
ncbi:MAG: hypothetical protein GIX03_07605 [Candidatus Eremiobacteraeota bacterium]|nr:hypothetical protein [Candidatus Eremiobacteraeota bacterium]MBC5802854.1 hypothetical protein [Candidatus Eremiobacteraeota bacterium]MBC5821471.1 hypothetical protein [Candidatus Eremiobacteraeota bacterium]